MKFAGKEYGFYWQSIRWPSVVLIAWMLFGLIASFTALNVYFNVFGNGWVGVVIMFAAFVISGYLVTADQKASAKQGAWAGALTGVVAGVAGIAIAIVSLYNTELMNAVVQQSLARAAEQGAAISEVQLRQFMHIGMVVNMVIIPFFYGLLGALGGFVGHFVAKKI